MKQLIVLLAAIVMIPFHLFSQEREVKTTITDVTVFFQGAQLSRESEAFQVGADQTVVYIRNLEQSLMENSLRIGVEGNARILNVVRSIDFIEVKENSDRIEELKADLKKNQETIQDKQAKVRVYDQELLLLAANKELGGTNTGVSVAAIREGASFYRERLMEIEGLKLDTRRSIQKLEEKNRKINAQLNELNYKKNRPTSTIEVTLEASKAGSCSLFLDYIVPEASWQPSYDIRIDQVGDPVKVTRKAAMSQSTGEDWKNVNLSFSTANPMESQILPELRPWYVNITLPVQNNIMVRGAASLSKSKGGVRQMQAQSAPRAEVLDEEYAMEDEAFEFDMPVASMTSSSNTSNLEFTLDTKANISPDGKAYTFSIGSEELQAAYHYQSVPKKEKSAFLMATMTDWEGYELVDGTANIYFEQTFIGETFLSTAMTLDSLQLSMGKDKGLIVERKSVKEFTRTRNVGSNVRKSFGYEISIRNTKTTKVKLIVEDQIPISSNSDIEVDLEDSGKGVLVESTGIITWRLELEPGETAKLPLKYTIKYPKGYQLDF